MIELRLSSSETRYAAVQPASSGSSPNGWRVISKAKTIAASSACDAPAKIAAMPTSAATLRVDVRRRRDRGRDRTPSSAPRPPPMVNSGASVPPDVPLPR